MKIAPTLKCSDAVSATCHPAMCECVAKRMKVLESVARAAQRTRDSDATDFNAEISLGRALARLAKVSKP